MGERSGDWSNLLTQSRVTQSRLRPVPSQVLSTFKDRASTNPLGELVLASGLPHSKKAFSYVQVGCYPNCMYGYVPTLLCFPEIMLILIQSHTNIHTFTDMYILFSSNTCHVCQLSFWRNEAVLLLNSKKPVTPKAVYILSSFFFFCFVCLVWFGLGFFIVH